MKTIGILFCLVLFFSLFVSVSRGQESIQLGTFSPITPSPTQMPSPTQAPNIPTATRSPKEENTHAPNPSPKPRDPCQYQYPSDDNFNLGWAKIAVSQFQQWVQPFSDEQTAFIEAQVWEFNDKVSRKLYNPAWLYTKGIVRLSVSQGFGLDKKDELYSTLSPLSCEEKTQRIASYLESPLFFYPEKSQKITLSLPQSIVSPHEKNVQTVDQKKTFQFTVDTSGKIRFEDEKEASYFSYDNPNIPYFPKQESGRLLEYEHLNTDLYHLALESGLNEKESNIFVSYFNQRLPKAKYYLATLLGEDTAEVVMPWTIHPTPDRQIRFLFAFQPFLEKPTKISSQSFKKPARSGFTVVDFAGIIVY